MLTISRQNTYADSLRKYKIYSGNEIIGEIRNGETITIDIPVGYHDLYVKMDWCCSPLLRINYKKEPIKLICSTRIRGFRLFLNIFYLIFLSKKCLILDEMIE